MEDFTTDINDAMKWSDDRNAIRMSELFTKRTGIKLIIKQIL